MNSMTNSFSGPTIVPRHMGTIPPPCFALAQHPLSSIHPGAPPLRPHPLTSSPFPLLLFHSLRFLCTMRCREEEKDGGRDKGKERGLLLAFRWLHMKSQSTHLGCRHRRPTSHLLPLSIPQLASSFPCAAQACTDRDRHICEGILVEPHTCVRWIDHTATFRLFALNGLLRAARGEFSRPSVFSASVFYSQCFQVSVRCQVAACLCVFKAAVAWIVFTAHGARQRGGERGEVRGGRTGFDLMQTV